MTTRLVRIDGPGVVYIGHGSPWMTPFHDGAGAVERFRRYVARAPGFIDEVRSLRGKRLYCPDCPWGNCHGQVLVELADDPALELFG